MAGCQGKSDPFGMGEFVSAQVQNQIHPGKIAGAGGADDGNMFANEASFAWFRKAK